MRTVLCMVPMCLTFTAMLLGAIAIHLSYVSDNAAAAVVLLVVAGCFDAIDGKVANKLNAESRMGEQLDSLSDMLNFALAPSLIIFNSYFQDNLVVLGGMASSFFLMCGGYRLARFNVTREKSIASGFFIGIPTPAGAFLALLPIVLDIGYMSGSMLTSYLVQYCIAGWMFIIGILMVSRFKTLSSSMLMALTSSPKGILLGSVFLLSFIVCAAVEFWATYVVITSVYIISLIVGIIACRFRKATDSSSSGEYDHYNIV